MRKKEFIIESNVIRILYHTSRKSNRDSILKIGLEPRNQEDYNIVRKPGIYMFESLAQAKEWAFWFAMTVLEPIDIWKISIPKNYKLIKDNHSEMDIYNAVIGYTTIPPENLKVIKTQPSVNSSHNAPKRAPLIKSDITEGLNHPCIVVDVQPEYSGMHDGGESPVFSEIIHFVNKQTGPVLMLVNAENNGLTGDTVQDIARYWEDTLREENVNWEDIDNEGSDYPEHLINWNRFTIVDKGYGGIRTFMDAAIKPSTIIKLIRYMYQMKVSDSRELFGGENSTTYASGFKSFIGPEFEDWMLSDGIYVNWISIAQLKKFNGAYLMGGGAAECLREVELFMNAFNIKYKRIRNLVY